MLCRVQVCENKVGVKFNLLLKDINKTCNIRKLFLFLHQEPQSFVRDEDEKYEIL